MITYLMIGAVVGGLITVHDFWVFFRDGWSDLVLWREWILWFVAFLVIDCLLWPFFILLTIVFKILQKDEES